MLLKNVDRVYAEILVANSTLSVKSSCTTSGMYAVVILEGVP